MRSRGPIVIAALVAGTALIGGAASCLSFGDLSGGGGADAGDDGSIGSNDGSAIDSAAPSDGSIPSDGGIVGDSACPGIAGPLAVRVGTGASSFCIDSTEVTLRHYRQFLAAVDGGATVLQPPACAFNTNLQTPDLNKDDFTPVTGVDWCDAYAFCAWSGKHMCRKIGGGALSATNVGNPNVSQWMRACTLAPDGGTQLYPYGNTPSATACNGAELDAGNVMEVATLPACVGGAPGVFDMSGNVDEWDEGCDGTTGATDCCDTRGGGFHDVETACGIGDTIPASCVGRTRADAHSDVGFRCCGD